jgi:hypothetical protein
VLVERSPAPHNYENFFSTCEEFLQENFLTKTAVSAREPFHSFPHTVARAHNVTEWNNTRVGLVFVNIFEKRNL